MGIRLGDILNLGAVFLNNGHNSPGKANTLSIIGTVLNIFSGNSSGNTQQGGNIGWPSLFGGQQNCGYRNQNPQQVLAIQNGLNQAFNAGQQQIQNNYNMQSMQMQYKFLNEQGKLVKELQDKKITQEQYDAKMKALEDELKLAKQQLDMQAQQLVLNLQAQIQNQRDQMFTSGMSGGGYSSRGMGGMGFMGMG